MIRREPGAGADAGGERGRAGWQQGAHRGSSRRAWWTRPGERGETGRPRWRTGTEPQKLASRLEGSEPGSRGAAPHPRPGSGGGWREGRGLSGCPGPAPPDFIQAPSHTPSAFPEVGERVGVGEGEGERETQPLGGGGAVLSRHRSYNI